MLDCEWRLVSCDYDRLIATERQSIGCTFAQASRETYTIYCTSLDADTVQEDGKSQLFLSHNQAGEFILCNEAGSTQLTEALLPQATIQAIMYPPHGVPLPPSVFNSRPCVSSLPRGDLALTGYTIKELML